ncbi:MAG TPA: acyl-protein synthetase [Candidatus Ozemobacteraceae bacterium]|nr:acyl-protein synthetase [Candidatus Ozemobacteraceae bacterium]
MAEKPPFEACGRLFDVSDAFSHSPATEAVFAEAMREALVWHRSRCPEFAGFLDRKGLGENAMPEPDEIPPLFVTIFKEHRLVSIPDSQVKIELTSSGTGGQRSAIVLDRRSYQRILRIVDSIFGSLGLVNHDETVDYLCFTYDPRIAKNVGTAFSDKILTGLTRRGSVFYAIRWSEATGSFEFDLGRTVRRLLAFARRGRPIRILGFPAYLWQVCDELEKRGKRLKLGNRSFVITGGGWKIHKEREVTKQMFKKRVSSILGLPEENIRDSFGMVEHGIPYVDCEHGRLHVPVFARARVIDPESLRPLPDGEPGLLHLMTPYLSSYPSISLLTTDRARLADRCPCGRRGKTIEILGRAGVAKHKGCAITALELLKQ